MHSLPMLDLLVPVFVLDELPEEILQGLLCISLRVLQVGIVLLLLLEDIALVLELLVHGLVLASSVLALYCCEGPGHSVEDEDIFDVNELSEALLMAHCLPLEPPEDGLFLKQ